MESFGLLCDGSSRSSSSIQSSTDSVIFQEIDSKRMTQAIIPDKQEVVNAFIAESRMAHGSRSRGGTRGTESPRTGGGGESGESRTPSTTDNPSRTAGAGNEHPHRHGDAGRCLSSRILSMTWVPLSYSYQVFASGGLSLLPHIPTIGIRAEKMTKSATLNEEMRRKAYGFSSQSEDELGYRLYDPIEKKVVRSRDVVFMEDQTIDDIDKLEKTAPMKNNDMTDVSPVRLPVHNPNTAEGNVQHDVQHDYVNDQQLGDEFDVPINDVEEQLELPQDEIHDEAPEPSPIQLKRSTRKKQPSI
ncbi:hypothetical protein AKJ16_DCAP15686, partial [Drosera capensis]